jgi:hypothetical protein
MNAILLTVLALSGADGGYYIEQGHGGDYASGGACEECGGFLGRHGHCHHCKGMPQSCYNPSFGCYPSTRFMHRYPAFHNYSTREAYNYRHYFDYPWHAAPHEPMPMFSGSVSGGPESIVVPLASERVPTPAPTAIRYQP